MSDRYDQGMKTRRAVLGDAHVNKSEASKTEIDEPFQSLIAEGAWGTVWSSGTHSLNCMVFHFHVVDG